MVRMGDRHRQRIGAVAAGKLHAGQQPADHRMNLGLVRAARADHRLFHQPRGIFIDGYAAASGRQQHDAAGLAELQCRLGIFVDEHLLDRGRRGMMLRQDLAQNIVQPDQALGKRVLRVGPDLAVGDMAQPVTFGGNDTPAGAGEPGIEADQDQASFSITSSGTS